jgi:hypothetical protein
MSSPLPPVDPSDLANIAAGFALEAPFAHGTPHGNGLINDSFVVDCQGNGSSCHYILQRVNHHVFQDVPALMENVQRVTDHLSKLASSPNRRPLRLIRTVGDQTFHVDAHGCHWRCYDFITGAVSYDVIPSLPVARSAAYAFGEFQAQLADLAGPRLNETIPDFHNTRQRFANLSAAIDADTASRVSSVGPEIEFALTRESLASALLNLYEEGKIPERITHNDTKISNVLIDEASGEGVCVIDFDTVMPGLGLYDFGDLVRSATNPCLEDETDLSQVSVQLPVFEQLVAGYLDSARSILNATEIDQLIVSGRLITFEIGLRFLTDYLAGDIYFRTERPEQNLDRARGQFTLLKSMESAESELRKIVNKYV